MPENKTDNTNKEALSKLIGILISAQQELWTMAPGMNELADMFDQLQTLPEKPIITAYETLMQSLTDIRDKLAPEGATLSGAAQYADDKLAETHGYCGTTVMAFLIKDPDHQPSESLMTLIHEGEGKYTQPLVKLVQAKPEYVFRALDLLSVDENGEVFPQGYGDVVQRLPAAYLAQTFQGQDLQIVKLLQIIDRDKQAELIPELEKLGQDQQLRQGLALPETAEDSVYVAPKVTRPTHPDKERTLSPNQCAVLPDNAFFKAVAEMEIELAIEALTIRIRKSLRNRESLSKRWVDWFSAVRSFEQWPIESQHTFCQLMAECCQGPAPDHHPISQAYWPGIEQCFLVSRKSVLLVRNTTLLERLMAFEERGPILTQVILNIAAKGKRAIECLQNVIEKGKPNELRAAIHLIQGNIIETSVDPTQASYRKIDAALCQLSPGETAKVTYDLHRLKPKGLVDQLLSNEVMGPVVDYDPLMTIISTYHRAHTVPRADSDDWIVDNGKPTLRLMRMIISKQAKRFRQQWLAITASKDDNAPLTFADIWATRCKKANQTVWKRLDQFDDPLEPDEEQIAKHPAQATKEHLNSHLEAVFGPIKPDQPLSVDDIHAFSDWLLEMQAHPDHSPYIAELLPTLLNEYATAFMHIYQIQNEWLDVHHLSTKSLIEHGVAQDQAQFYIERINQSIGAKNPTKILKDPLFTTGLTKEKAQTIKTAITQTLNTHNAQTARKCLQRFRAKKLIPMSNLVVQTMLDRFDHQLKRLKCTSIKAALRREAQTIQKEPVDHILHHFITQAAS